MGTRTDSKVCTRHQRQQSVSRSKKTENNKEFCADFCLFLFSFSPLSYRMVPCACGSLAFFATQWTSKWDEMRYFVSLRSTIYFMIKESEHCAKSININVLFFPIFRLVNNILMLSDFISSLIQHSLVEFCLQYSLDSIVWIIRGRLEPDSNH